MNFDWKKIKECMMRCNYKKIKESVMGFDYKKIKYELNVGSTDQKIRYGVGVGVLLLSLFKGKVILLLLGVALIASAYTKWCPAYSGLGKNTCCKDTVASEESNEQEDNNNKV